MKRLEFFYILAFVLMASGIEAHAQESATAPSSRFTLGAEAFRVFTPKFSRYEVSEYGAQIGFLSGLDSAASSPSGGWFMRGTLAGPYYVRGSLAVMYRPWGMLYFRAGIAYHSVDLNLYFGKMSFHVTNDDFFQNLMMEYGVGLLGKKFVLELTAQNDIHQIRLGAFDVPDAAYTRFGITVGMAYIF